MTDRDIIDFGKWLIVYALALVIIVITVIFFIEESPYFAGKEYNGTFTLENYSYYFRSRTVMFIDYLKYFMLLVGLSVGFFCVVTYASRHDTLSMKNTGYPLKNLFSRFSIDTKAKLFHIFEAGLVVTSFMMILLILFSVTSALIVYLNTFLICFCLLTTWHPFGIISRYELSIYYLEEFREYEDKESFMKALQTINEILNDQISIKELYDISCLVSVIFSFKMEKTIEGIIDSLIKELGKKKKDKMKISSLIPDLYFQSKIVLRRFDEILMPTKLPISMKIKMIKNYSMSKILTLLTVVIILVETFTGVVSLLLSLLAS